MSIFSTIFGKSNSSQLIDKLDGLIDKLPTDTNIEIDNYDTLASRTIKDVINYSDDSKDRDKLQPESQSQIEQIFNGIAIPKERLNRYNVYDEIFKTVPLIKRIFSVYTANVFQKDTITNKILYIRDKTNIKDDAELENSKKVAKLILEYYGLEEKLKHFVGHNAFKYGDAFVEVLDLDTVAVKFPTITAKNNQQAPSKNSKIQAITDAREIINNGKYISEDSVIDSIYDNIKSKNKYKRDLTDKYFDDFCSLFVEFNDNVEYYDEESPNIDIILESDDLVDLKGSVQNFDHKKFRRVALRMHRPHNMLPIISPYGNVLGYIELKTVEKSMTTNSLHRFLEIAEKISSLSREGNTKDTTDQLILKFVDYTIKKILEKNNIVKGNKQSFSEYEQTIKDILKDDLFYSLKQTYLGIQKDNLFRNKVNIRFITADNVFWFKSPSSEYYPYGQSLIDPLVVPGKLLTFNQLANAIIKLSRASLIRKWTVELGSREDSSALLQKLKRTFKNQRVTASDLGTTKDIANILSD